MLQSTSLTSVAIGNSVTSIGDHAFYECISLTSVAIPSSVTSIEEGAFSRCTSLTSVAIPNSVTSIGRCAFSGCTSLPSVTIGSSVTSIGNYTFEGCTSLTSVTIGHSVTSIGEEAFRGGTDLKWIDSQAIVPPTIKSNTFSSYNVPLLAASSSYKTTGYWKNFTKQAISYDPEGATFEVGGLKYEIISVNDLTCRLYALDETTTGEDVVIPETVVYKNRTFTPIEIKGVLVKGESSVKSISIPNTVTSISSGTIFLTALEKLTVSVPSANNLASYSSIDELVITPYASKLSTNLSTNNVAKITIEDSESPLDTPIFNCEATKDVYLGRNVSAKTFSGLTSIETVTISDKVTSIDNTVFSSCRAIRTVVSRNITPPATTDPFSNDAYIYGVLYVPEASINAYQAATGWKNFWDIKSLNEYNGIDDIVVDDSSMVTIENGTISVVSEEPVKIVATNGVAIYSGHGDTRVNVSPGIYIVVIGTKAHKVAVK